jgi:hypothetical protein
LCVESATSKCCPVIPLQPLTTGNRHNCLFHGQIREHPESDSAAASSGESSKDELELLGIVGAHKSSQQTTNIRGNDAESEDDIVAPVHYDSEDMSDVERIVNYKFHANPYVKTKDGWPNNNVTKRTLPPPGPFKPRWWELRTSTVNWEKRKPFIPCNHDGSCVEAKCRCFRENITCEKTCRCPSTCNRRFPGCKCAFVPGKRTCATVTGCLCIKFKRECDADLCGTCGATDILDPTNRYNEELLRDKCANVGLQRGVPKKTLLGKSEVHGFGLYAGEDIREDEVIGEYTGEILSVGESARREVVYQHEQNMYLFRLNKEQEVDATHMGNKLRFINNANKSLSNCTSKVLFCNTVFRVALLAMTDIKAGSEFFFHYNYPAALTKNFKQPKGKVVAVKQIVKPPGKLKMKRGRLDDDSTRSVADAYAEKPDRPWLKEALAKARAAKAAKRAAMLAETGLEAPTTAGSNNKPKQARKSASGGTNSYQTSKNPDSKGRIIASKPRLDTRAKSRTPTLVVQDTDDEDEEHTPQETQAGAAGPDIQVAEVGEDEFGREDADQINSAVPRREESPRARMPKVKKKMGGARPGAGRKRKRPRIVNSEDE